MSGLRGQEKSKKLSNFCGLENRCGNNKPESTDGRKMSSLALNWYHVYGITLASQLRHNLPEEQGQSDVVVQLTVAQPHIFRNVADKLRPDGNDWMQHQLLADHSLYMRWENCLELLVSADGKTVACGNLSNHPFEAFDAYLSNFAVSAALLQQGEEPLHATVVAKGDDAVGFIGASGRGKSTLAAHFVARGWDLVTDDMLRVTFEGSKVVAHSGPHRLKLYKDSAERCLDSADCDGPFNPTCQELVNSLSNKLIFQLPNRTTIRRTRHLFALLRLDYLANETDSIGELVPLGGQEMFTTILSSTMNSRYQTRGRLQRQFQFAERLVRSVPVYRLAYPRRYDAISDTVEKICKMVTR